MKIPKFSIITPVYNTEPYLEDCLRSVINQSYNDWEMICVDDGSNDDSVGILEKYERQDSRISVMKLSFNQGPGCARNKGLEVAKGEYLMFLDSDDYLDSNTLETINRNSSLPDVDILVYNGRAFDHNTQRMFDRKYNNLDVVFFHDNHIDDKYMPHLIDFHSPCMKVYSKSFLKRNAIYFPESIVGEDVEFWMKCLVNLPKINYIDFEGYYRRYRENSIMTGDSIRNVKDRISNFDSLMSICCDNIAVNNYLVEKYIPYNIQRAYATQNQELIKYAESTLDKLIEKYN